MTVRRILLVDDHALVRAGIRPARVAAATRGRGRDRGRPRGGAARTGTRAGRHPARHPDVGIERSRGGLTHCPLQRRSACWCCRCMPRPSTRRGHSPRGSPVPDQGSASMSSRWRSRRWAPGVAIFPRHRRSPGGQARAPDCQRRLRPRRVDAPAARDPAAGGGGTRHAPDRGAAVPDVKTVETHRAQIMQRLDIRDVPGLVRFAIRHGLCRRNRPDAAGAANIRRSPIARKPAPRPISASSAGPFGPRIPIQIRRLEAAPCPGLRSIPACLAVFRGGDARGPGGACRQAQATEPDPADRRCRQDHGRQGHARDRWGERARPAVHRDHQCGRRAASGRTARRQELHVPAVRPARAAQDAERPRPGGGDAGRIPALAAG